VLGWVSYENLAALEILSEVALGLILFSIGSVFEFNRFATIGRQVVFITLAESSLAALLVTSCMFALGQPWQVACLLGAVAMATAPASTLMVIRECNSSGPLSTNLLGIIAVNNVFCLTTFILVSSVIDFSSSLAIGRPLFDTFYRSVFPLVWQLLGSVALGYLVGLLLAGWAKKVTEHGEVQILLAGCVLLCVGTALLLDLSTLIASLAVGATMVNLSASSHRLFESLTRTDPPFYAIFFVVAGADLDIHLIESMGMLGFAYLTARASGKFLGAMWSAWHLNLERTVQKYLGFGLMAQAGLAVGIALVVDRRFPLYAEVVTTVILASVVIYEMFGPISTKFALIRSGEAHQKNHLTATG
tara:strand:+ start:3911 stop:4990 length:1080 start_codon:yes stop_codon:yes gene_type:complete